MFLSLLDLVRRSGGLSQARLAAPAVEIQDQGGALCCRARLEGVDPRSVQVQVRENSLALSGYGTMEERTEGPNFVRTQSAISSFYREIPLPVAVDPHRSAVQWQADGHLLIICPKR